MLNGIGGPTVEQAQANMSAAEFDLWVRYRQKYGSLHLGRRIEQSTALLASQQVNIAAGKAVSKPSDYMPHEPEPELTAEEAMQQWQ